VGELRERCRPARAAGAADESFRQRAIHRSRHLRHWSDPDGAFRMDLRTTPDAGARFLAGLRPFCRKAFAEARSAGRRESAEAHAADALVDMAEAAGGTGDQRRPGPRAMVYVRVDYDALSRGHSVAGETCEIPGVGPIPVASARAMAADAILKVLLTKGVDVVAVAHSGRSATGHQRSALEERDRTCVVEGCAVRDHFEIDHVDGWAVTRTTTLERLARLCRWHHHLKTYCGYRLEGRPGAWRLVRPDTPLEDDAGGMLDLGVALDAPAG
jgi:hypothetical protein